MGGFFRFIEAAKQHGLRSKIFIGSEGTLGIITVS
jgi:hypothetical protein